MNRLYADAVRLSERFDTAPVHPLLAEDKASGLRVVGISFHVGSLSENPQAYGRAYREVRHIYNQVLQLGFQPQCINIGGRVRAE